MSESFDHGAVTLLPGHALGGDDGCEAPSGRGFH
jgi:hypothetical protein